jgi:xanthine dehydrogenase accessory factor
MIAEPDRVFKILDEALESGREVALVTLIADQGSTPRDSGAHMAVFPDRTIAGSVGGGKLEDLCIDEAVEAIKEGKARRAAFDLTPKGIGMVCSGRAEVYIEVFPGKIKLLILGGGHVGLKIAQAAECACIPYSVADEREDCANRARFPKAVNIYLKEPHKAVSRDTVDARTYIVIVTRGHMLDSECLKAALPTKAAYIGMIGSGSKVRTVYKEQFNSKGLHPEKDKRVFSPIGLNISDKTPGEIAIAVMAEILKLANNKPGGHMSITAQGK